MTARLYFEDPLLLAFDARVVGHGSWQGRPTVLLDRTAFYAEAGGQMADRGRLGEQAIVDIQADDDGVVHHLVEGPLPAIGTELRGEIDRARRRVHMALHTGQHMLSRALVDVAGAETVSSRLGETLCTIDVDLAAVPEVRLAQAEDLVNSVIENDVAIRAWFPEAVELRGLPLRRPPKVEKDVRVVSIGDFDVSPCGGTHCLRSAQVGLVKIASVERYKGKIRVNFSAGRRAVRELGGEVDTLRGMAREMSCGPLDVPRALEKLRGELATVRETLGAARARLAEAEAERLATSGARVVALLDDAELLQPIGKRLTAREGVVAFLAAPSAEGLRVLVARGPGSDFDCGAFLKRAAAAAGGRGGGRPESAQGQLPAGADWPVLVAAHAAS